MKQNTFLFNNFLNNYLREFILVCLWWVACRLFKILVTWRLGGCKVSFSWPEWTCKYSSDLLTRGSEGLPYPQKMWMPSLQLIAWTPHFSNSLNTFNHFWMSWTFSICLVDKLRHESPKWPGGGQDITLSIHGLTFWFMALVMLSIDLFHGRHLHCVAWQNPWNPHMRIGWLHSNKSC
jgi:hypothetical protein